MKTGRKIVAVRNRKTVYREGGYAIKVFDGSFKKSDILNEALNQARVEETGLNIPKLIEVGKVDGKWAIVSEFIEGETLETLMNDNPDNLDVYLDMFVELQMDIHDKRAPLLNKLSEKMKRKISEADLEAAVRYELQTRLDSLPKHNKVCHGDYNPSNIIVSEDGTPYVIDWSHATQGNASADVARTYLLFWLNGKPDLAEKYLELFCAKSVTDKRYVQRWVPIVAASQLVKGKEEERDFLMHWIDVVEYE